MSQIENQLWELWAPAHSILFWEDNLHNCQPYYFIFPTELGPQRYASAHPWILEIRLYTEKGSLQMRLSERF